MIDKIEQILPDTPDENIQAYWLHWNYLKAKYANEIEQNKEKPSFMGLRKYLMSKKMRQYWRNYA